MSEFLRSYLFVYLFCLGLSLGSLANLMLHQLTGGRWGDALRGPMVAAAGLLPLVAIFCFPLLIDLPLVFRWMGDPASVADKSWWLNRPFFLARAALYLAIWSVLALRWLALAARARGTRSPELIRLSAAGLIIYGITVTLAAIDWIMSLTPEWYSSTFGLVVGVAAMQAAMALAVCARTWPALTRPRSAARPQQSAESRALCGDFANLLLMYILTLTYLSYTQYLIVWAEDLPKEIAWYLPRLQTSWRAITLVLILLQFIVPFLLLLMRPIKRDARYLGLIAAVLLLCALLTFFYLVKPAFMPSGLALRWSDPAVAVVFIGAWFLAWRRRLPAVRIA
ncbi:MAG TPA: hypothetical protein VHX52_13805 [Steroidobacteraceae bacterium]|jgi:hypothetical protein|nr:hypothetical protein [Steroidobacteraceae bacterium]